MLKLFSPEFKETPNDIEDELEEIRNEVAQEFDAYEPLTDPFECEDCSFSTTDSIVAAEHIEWHTDINHAKSISRWEPSVSSIRTSVITENPNFPK